MAPPSVGSSAIAARIGEVAGFYGSLTEELTGLFRPGALLNFEAKLMMVMTVRKQ